MADDHCFLRNRDNQESDNNDECGSNEFKNKCYLVDDIRSNLNEISNSNDYIPIFDWHEDHFVPRVYSLNQTNLGPQIPKDIGNRESDLFKLFLDKKFVESIAQETNRHYQFFRNEMKKSTWRLNKWQDTNMDELYLFFSVCLLMTCNSRDRLEDYWSTDLLLHSPIYSNTMSRNRFQALLRMLHFCDINQRSSGDRMFQIRSVVNHFRTTFRKYLHPGQNLSMSEKSFWFKGHVALDNEASGESSECRFWIKICILCDSATGYVLDFVLYSTEDEKFGGYQNLGVEGNIVMSLMQSYLDRGHSLFIGNEYASPKLLHHLFCRKTNACGLVKAKTKDKVKDFPKLKTKLNKNEFKCFHTDTISIQYWKERKDFSMLTTFHRPMISNTGKFKSEPGIKPQCFQEYSRQMIAVTRCDELMATIHSSRRTLRWYIKVFFHLMDIAMLNSHTLYQDMVGKKIPFAKFQLEVIRQLIKQHGYKESMLTIDHKRFSSRSTFVGAVNLKSDGQTPARLVERHFFEKLPPTEKRTIAMGRCLVCAANKTRRETRYRCKQCLKPLCIEPCFEIYHTTQDISKSPLFVPKSKKQEKSEYENLNKNAYGKQKSFNKNKTNSKNKKIKMEYEHIPETEMKIEALLPFSDNSKNSNNETLIEPSASNTDLTPSLQQQPSIPLLSTTTHFLSVLSD